MKQLIKNGAVFIILAYIISLVLSFAYTEFFRHHKSNQSKTNWVLMRKGDTLDYVTLGSSRVFHMVDVPLLNKLTGKKGMNLGTAGSSYADNYTLLLKYLECNAAKVLVLNADELCFHSSVSYPYPFKDYDYMPYFFEETVNQVYKENIPAWKYYLWTGIPLSRYIEFNEHYEFGPALWLNKSKPMCKLDTTAGTELLYNMKYKKFSQEDTANVKHDTLVIEHRDERYFYKILSLCRQKGMKVILITTPLFTRGVYALSNRAKFQYYIEHLALKEKLPYINFIEITTLRDIKYFRDMTHTNIQGTDIYTRYLARKIQPFF